MNIEIRSALAKLKIYLERIGYLLRARIVEEPPDLGDTQTNLYNAIYSAVNGYLSSGGAVTAHRNKAVNAVFDNMSAAFYRGYLDAGGEETEREDETWLTGEIDRQIDFVYSMFESLRDIRKSGDYDADAIADGRASNWSGTVTGVYAEGKLRGSSNKMLTFDGDDGSESCVDCQRYKGQRHSARWWITRDLVRRSGNENFACGRWEPCKHFYWTDDGELWAA